MKTVFLYVEVVSYDSPVVQEKTEFVLRPAEDSREGYSRLVKPAVIFIPYAAARVANLRSALVEGDDMRGLSITHVNINRKNELIGELPLSAIVTGQPRLNFSVIHGDGTLEIGLINRTAEDVLIRGQVSVIDMSKFRGPKIVEVSNITQDELFAQKLRNSSAYGKAVPIDYRSAYPKEITGEITGNTQVDSSVTWTGIDKKDTP